MRLNLRRQQGPEAVSITNYSSTFAFLPRPPGMQIASPRVTFWPSQSAAIPVIMSQETRFWGKTAWRKMRVLVSSATVTSNPSHSKQNSARYCNTQPWPWCRVPDAKLCIGTRNFTEIRPVGAGLIHAGRRTDIHKTKLTTIATKQCSSTALYEITQDCPLRYRGPMAGVDQTIMDLCTAHSLLNMSTFRRNVLLAYSGWMNWFKWMLKWHSGTK
jgi:hypothetical protein